MLKVEGLRKTFNKNTENEIDIFRNLNIEFEENICTAIIGPNGCGKSTLLNIIAGSIESDRGNIMLDEKNIGSLREEDRAEYIGRVYQDPSRGVSPSLTVLENLSLAMKKGEKFSLKKLIHKDDRKYLTSILEDLNLGLEDKLDIKVKYLSGGQRQALSLVMATLKNPKVLLLDEHTAALDPKTSKIIMEKTRELIDRHSMTTLMISHNMRDAIKYSDKILMLDGGEVVLYENSKDLSEKDLFNIYNA